MEVYMIYCPSCGFESYDTRIVAYSRTTADDDWVICPGCLEETSHFNPVEEPTEEAEDEE